MITMFLVNIYVCVFLTHVIKVLVVYVNDVCEESANVIFYVDNYVFLHARGLFFLKLIVENQLVKLLIFCYYVEES